MVLLGLAMVCRADEVALVRVGESWQYFLGYGEPSTPPGAWQQPVFDDAAWNRGPSGFGTITADDATFFYDLFPSLYLRRQFELANPARVRWLVLRIEYVDGFVAYLNGVEIARRGVAGPPNSFVPFDALADWHSSGNHDRYANTYDYLQSFCLPTNSATGTEEFYSFDDGDGHFVVLDTVLPTGNGCAPGSPQYQWLEADLATSRKPWKFLFFHNTIRNSGYPHRYDDYNGNLIPDRIELQNSIGYLAGRYQVQVIFTGHDHTYERLGPVNGTHTIISGGGGAVLYSSCGFWDESSSQFWSRYNCVRISVSADTLQLEALDERGGGVRYHVHPTHRSAVPDLAVFLAYARLGNRQSRRWRWQPDRPTL